MCWSCSSNIFNILGSSCLYFKLVWLFLFTKAYIEITSNHGPVCKKHCSATNLYLINMTIHSFALKMIFSAFHFFCVTQQNIQRLTRLSLRCVILTEGRGCLTVEQRKRSFFIALLERHILQNIAAVFYIPQAISCDLTIKILVYEVK